MKFIAGGLGYIMLERGVGLYRFSIDSRYSFYIICNFRTYANLLSIICEMHSVARLFHEYWKAPEYTAAWHSMP